MNCRQAHKHICESLDEKIDSPRCRAIKKHLEECPNCRHYLKSVKKTVKLYKKLPCPDLSTESRKKLFSALKADKLT